MNSSSKNKKVINVPGIGNDGKYTDPREIKALERFLKAEEEGQEKREAVVDLKKQEKLPREGNIELGSRDITLPVPENKNSVDDSNPSIESPKLNNISSSKRGKISRVDLNIPEIEKSDVGLEYLENTAKLDDGTIKKENLEVPVFESEIEDNLLTIPENSNKNNAPNTDVIKITTNNSQQPNKFSEKLYIDEDFTPGTIYPKINIEEKDLSTNRVELSVEEKDLNTDKINLSIEEKDLSTNRVELSVEEKDLNTNKINLSIEEKDLSTNRIELSVEEKDLNTDKINLSIEEKDLSTNRVELSVEESSGKINKVILPNDNNNASPNIDLLYSIPENTIELSLDNLLTSEIIEDLSKFPENNEEIIIPEGIPVSNPQLDKKLIDNNLGNLGSNFFKYQLPEDSYIEEEHNYFNPKDLTDPPYDSVLSVPDDLNINKYVDFLNETYDNNNLSSLPEDIGGQQHDYIPQSDQNKLEEYKYNTALKLADELSGMKVEVAGKISTAISSYLSSPTPSISDVEGYESRMNNIKKIMSQSLKTRYKVADYKLPEFDIDYSLNPSNYLRYLAEKSLPIKSSNPNTLVNLSTVRETLLDEALSLLITTRDMLERATKVNRERLPGGGSTSALATDIAQNGLSLDTLSSAISAVVSPAPEVRFPINRPEGGNTIGWEDGNKYVLGAGNTNDSTYKERLKNYVVGSSGKIDYKFEDRYLKGEGINLTLSELCGYGAHELKSVEELKKALSESPYYTTSKKFTTTKSGEFNIMTLDSNSYWEIILQPYVGSLNGYFSFLPDFREINLINQKMSGVMTGYNKWIPISSFELMKSKLGSKSINLFDGEINIPTSIEFTNELRLTIVDDMFKSWKLYFEKCMEVYVYNSESHYKDYYFNPGEEDLKHITAVDKSSICISPYKNVTFVCDIYIMTPQSETIKKFSLLVVLKDIPEEFAGDIDSGGTDLSISFSIVGENPPDTEFERSTALMNQTHKDEVMEANRSSAFNKSSEEMKKKADKAMPSAPTTFGTDSVKIFS